MGLKKITPISYLTNNNTPKSRYRQDLKDLSWILKAENIRKRDKHCCRLCRKNNVPLEVHHLRYIPGRKPWEYDDSDLVALCRECHEFIHNESFYNNMKDEHYFYDNIYGGVGIISYIGINGVSSHVCWTDRDSYKDGHGRLWTEDDSSWKDIRKATKAEIEEFWEEVFKYYTLIDLFDLLAFDPKCPNDKIFWHAVSKKYTINQLLYYFGDLVQDDYYSGTPIHDLIVNRCNENRKLFDTYCEELYSKFGSTLLVSDECFVFLQCTGYGQYGVEPYLAGPQFMKVPFSAVYDASKRYKAFDGDYVKYHDLDISEFRGSTEEEQLAFSDYLMNTIIPGTPAFCYADEEYAQEEKDKVHIKYEVPLSYRKLYRKYI